MRINDEKELTISEFFNLCESEEGEYQIDTPDGWQNINFLVKKKNKECFKLVKERDKELVCAATHKIFTNSGWKKSQDIDMSRDIISVRGGMEKVVKKKYIGMKDTFDLQVESLARHSKPKTTDYYAAWTG